MKTLSTKIVFVLMSLPVFAGESALTSTYQPLDGLGAGRIFIVGVTCHDWHSHSGQPTSIGLISAKNVPPTNSDKALQDLNLASASHIYFGCDDIESASPKIVMTADKFEAAGGYPQEEILRASLECFRRVLPPKLQKLNLTFTSSPENQGWISKIIAEFNDSNKTTPFYTTEE